MCQAKQYKYKTKALTKMLCALQSIGTNPLFHITMYKIDQILKHQLIVYNVFIHKGSST